MSDSNVFITDTPGVWLNQFLQQKRYSSLTVVVDDHTATHCYPLIRAALPLHHIIQLPAGEEFKNLATCTLIWQKLTDRHIDRHGLVIVLGGGVLGDMAGFCAATYKRGIDFLLVPTTLLAQADASVGGKLGIDFNHFKNHIGVFHLPVATLVSPLFLKTLPVSELRSGFAEVVKHCLLDGPEAWQSVTAQTLAEQNWATWVAHSVALKENITRQDPTEKGLRKVLNLGHTIGHAVETASLESEHRLLHGEAIAVGLMAEAFLSTQKGWLPESSLQEITHYLTATFGTPGQTLSGRAVLANARQDKKNKSNRILVVLLRDIGKPEWDVEVSEKELEASWQYYQSL
ncbi:MAG: 3-dehydroquinate synthase [Cyclobacteriaceae bacterium]|jgi:3-dehydroquinate synthase|nr:3-dehydroquinate synthase [Cyclobacteriaceae bacterium]